MSSDLPAPSADPGYDLPILLLLGFRGLIDDLHAELARQGHPELRPLHGFVFKAIGDGTTAGELGRRLGVSKQAAGKTVEGLERDGYVERVDDPGDARRKIVRLTERGRDVQARSARILAELRARWVDRLGAERVRALEEDLRTMTRGDLRFDTPAWFN